MNLKCQKIYFNYKKINILIIFIEKNFVKIIFYLNKIITFLNYGFFIFKHGEKISYVEINSPDHGDL